MNKTIRNHPPGEGRTISFSPGSIPASAVLLLLLFFSFFFFAGCRQTLPQPVTENDFALGTTCSIKLFGAEYRRLLQPALDIAGEVEQRMSVHLPESEINLINEKAGSGTVEVSAETYSLIQRAYYFSELSGGVFDLTVGPLVALWDIGSGNEKVPAPEALSAALERVNYEEMVFDPGKKRIGLSRPGMRIDLGAIAKGYAADRIVEFLRSEGVPYGILNLGGNVYAFGEKAGSEAWKIGIQSPEDDRGRYIGILEARDTAVVTSGKYERFFLSGGKRYHHILNTGDGFPVENGLASVSIVSSDATAADALSTLVFGLGLEEGLRMSEELQGVEAIIITENRTVYTTSGLRDRFTLSDKDYRRGETRHVLGGE